MTAYNCSIFWMMGVCVDGSFFALTRGNGLVTWPELTPFFMLKWEIGISAFWGEDFGESGLLKNELRSWPLRTMWCEKILVWVGKFLMFDWEPDGVLSGILYQLLNLLVEMEIFLYTDLRKFYRFSNSVSESPVRKKIFIVAEQRKFFQVFYRRIARPWTLKLWMLNTRMARFFSLQGSS